MTIKGMDGQSYNVTGQGQGTYNTVGASAGILALLQNGGLNGLLGGGCNHQNAGCSENMLVNRYELNMVEQLNAKDSEIALLKADKYTDQKIVEAYKDLQGQIKELAGEVRANKDAQTEVNMQQAVYNGKNTATLSCMQREIDALDAMTRRFVPSYNVCQSDCCGCQAQ